MLSTRTDITHRERLDKFGNIAAMLSERARQYVEGLTDVELAQLAESVDWPTQTNCWCAVYEAANWLRPHVKYEQRARAQKSAAV